MLLSRKCLYIQYCAKVMIMIIDENGKSTSHVTTSRDKRKNLAFIPKMFRTRYCRDVQCISRSTINRFADMLLERYIVMTHLSLCKISLWQYFSRTIYHDGMSRSLRDIAVAIFRWNEISARCCREAPTSRQIIVLTCC